jgi:hypothetical protein
MKLVVGPTKEADDDLRTREALHCVSPRQTLEKNESFLSSFTAAKFDSIERPSSNSINDQSIFASLPNVISNPNQRSTQVLMHSHAAMKEITNKFFQSR